MKILKTHNTPTNFHVTIMNVKSPLPLKKDLQISNDIQSSSDVFITVYVGCLLSMTNNIVACTLPFMTLLVPPTLIDSTCSFLSW